MQDDPVLSEEEIEDLLDQISMSEKESALGDQDCPGFLLIHKTDATGKVTGIEIREIIIRQDRTFYRYKKGCAKSRNRAMDKAKAAADYETFTFGLGETTFTELSGRNIEDIFMSSEEASMFSSTTPPTIGEKILRKVEDIFDILWEDRRAKRSQDIMCQREIEILLEGFRLGQKSQHK